MTTKPINRVFDCSPLTNLISQFAGMPQSTLPVSRAFSAAASTAAAAIPASDRIFKHLHRAYLAKPNLKAYISSNPLAKVATDLHVVQNVYTRVLQRARGMSLPVPAERDSLNPDRLERLSQATDLLTFFNRVARALPSAQNFLNELNEKCDSPARHIYERAELIQKWMQENAKDLQVIRELNLSYRGFVSLPKEIRFLTGLTSLNLSENQLVAVPAELGQLNQLISLTLSDNPLREIPEELRPLLTRLGHADLFERIQKEQNSV